jgi:hypothetical protein
MKRLHAERKQPLPDPSASDSSYGHHCINDLIAGEKSNAYNYGVRRTVFAVLSSGESNFIRAAFRRVSAPNRAHGSISQTPI